MAQVLFNPEPLFTELFLSRIIVEDECLSMWEVINYVIERTAEEELGTQLTSVVQMFNLYWYYIGKDVIEDWSHLMVCWRDWNHQDSDEEEETKENNNDQL